MPAPTTYEQLYSGLIKVESRVLVAGEPLDIIGHPSITQGLSSVSARADIPLVSWPTVAALRAPVVIYQRMNNAPWLTKFKGIVYRIARGNAPRRATINAIDYLYLVQLPAKEQFVFENVDAGEVVRTLLAAQGITDYVVQDTGWIIGRVYPVIVAIGQSPWSLIEELDKLEGYRTLCRPNGTVQRIRLPLFPGQAVAAAYRYAANETPPGELWVANFSRGGPGVAGIRNRVTVRGILLPGVKEEIAVALDVPFPLRYIPDSGTVVVEDTVTLANFVEDTDYTIDYTLGTFTPLGTGAIAAGQYVYVAYGTHFKAHNELADVYDETEFEYVPATLSAIPIEGTVVVTSPDESIEYEEGVNYSINYETGVLTPLAGPIPSVFRVKYHEAIDAEATEVEITRSGSNSALEPGQYQTEEISSNLIEDHQRAALIATRVLLDQNRDADAISFRAANNLELQIGQTVACRDADVDLPEDTPYLITDISGEGELADYRGIGGVGGELGYLDPIAPEALFDYRIFAIGDIAVLTLIDASFDLNDDIVAWAWNGEAYGSENTITLTFDTSIDTTFLAQIQVKDATDLTSGIYARQIDLLGSQDDIDTGRYRSLTIFELRDGTAALVMGGNRIYVGDGATEAAILVSLAKIGAPYFTTSLMYLSAARAMTRPLWDATEETFHGAHTFAETSVEPDIFDIPHTVYISTAYGALSSQDYDGYALEPPSEEWEDYLEGHGIASDPNWIWQYWDTVTPIGVMLLQAYGDGGDKRPGVYVQVFDLTPIAEGDLPLLISESYFRYQSLGEFGPTAPFAINPAFMDSPSSIPYPSDPGVASLYPAEYQATYGMPESLLGVPNFSPLATHQQARDVYRLDATGYFAGNPVWFTHSGTGTIYVALNFGVYVSSDQGNNWYALHEFADDIWAGDYVMDGEVDPVYRFGYKWGAVAGNEFAIALAITGWSVARDEEADDWFDYHVEGAVQPVIYKGHRQPVMILATGERPEFPEDTEVISLIALVGEAGFVVNARWLVAPDDEDVWQVQELVYEYPEGADEPDILGDLIDYRFIPHPSEPDIFIISSKAAGEVGKYWAFRRTAEATLEYLGVSDDPYPSTGGSWLAVTDQQFLPIEGFSVYSDDVAGVKSLSTAIDPTAWQSEGYDDDWWATPEDRGE